MKYAVIETGGKQYKVSENKEILIDKLDGEENSKIIFNKVLLIRTDKNILFGKPFIDKGEVVGKIVKNERGKKILVQKFKAKIRYRRKIGFRSQLTRVLIEKINISDRVEGKKAKKTIQSKEKK